MGKSEFISFLFCSQCCLDVFTRDYSPVVLIDARPQQGYIFVNFFVLQERVM